MAQESGGRKVAGGLHNVFTWKESEGRKGLNELEKENKEEKTCGVLRCVSLVTALILMCYCSFWCENVSLQKQAKDCDFDQNLSYRSCTADRSGRCKEVTAETVRKERLSQSHFSHSNEVSHLEA